MSVSRAQPEPRRSHDRARRSHTPLSAIRSDAAPKVSAVGAPALVALQRLAGNQAVLTLPHLQRLALVDGPPLAPGNYRYGNDIVSVDAKAMNKLLTDMAGRNGLVAERKWQAEFVAAMLGTPSGNVHKYEDPTKGQTVSVEPTMATNAEQGQRGVDEGVSAAQKQFQQDLLGTVSSTLDSSESRLLAEGKRYGFPNQESILNPTPMNAGQAAISASMPWSEEIRGMMRAAKALVDGKQKLKKAKDANAKMGPFLGEMVRPTTLEPVVKEYHALRQKQCSEYPILSSFERDDTKLGELASNAQFAQPGSAGPAATAALMDAQEKIRHDIADKLANIAYVKSNMNDDDKIKKFWTNPSLRDGTKRKMAIGTGSLPSAAIDDKIRDLNEDAEFDSKLKTAIGTGLLLASLIPGVGLVAGGIGMVMGAVDVYGAFQDFFWEEAASGTAMDKAEAISQTDPSLFSLGAALAFGLLEGVAEVKALEGAITVFKAVRGAYKEARAAAAIAKVAKGTGAAEVLAAQKKLNVAVESASEKPGLGAQIVATAMGDAESMAADLKAALDKIKDPALKDLIITASRDNPNEVSLADLAVADPEKLQADYETWKKISRDKDNPDRGKRFDDWLRDKATPEQPGTITDPAGLVEYGLDNAGAKRSFEAMISDDPSREAAIFRDTATGECVAVQGGHSFVEGRSWQMLKENFRQGDPAEWHLEIHYHPNRGLTFDRLPSMADFDLVTGDTLALRSRTPVQSAIAWQDPVSKIRFETEYGFVPGAERPFWTRYRVDDGTMRVASFKDPPWTGPGAAEYQQFLYNKAVLDPATAVPGGNVMPVPGPLPPQPPLPAPPGAEPNRLRPPPKPTR